MQHKIQAMTDGQLQTGTQRETQFQQRVHEHLVCVIRGLKSIHNLLMLYSDRWRQKQRIQTLIILRMQED